MADLPLADGMTPAASPGDAPATGQPAEVVTSAEAGTHDSTHGEPEAVMPLVEHLGELRSRLFKVILAVAIGSTFGFLVANPIIRLLAEPAGGRLLNLAPGDAFFIHIRISVVVGVVLAMPVILYQVWAFVAPGLTASERRIVRPWIPLALFFFALGCLIGYVVLPYAMAFLLSFDADVFVNELGAAQYFNFVTTLFLAFGLTLEFPIILYALSRVNVVTSAGLRRSRRYVILGITIFATVATPGGDLVSPFVLGMTMYVLFELTVWVIARTGH